MTPELEEALRVAKAEVAADGGLTFRTRRAMLLRMGPLLTDSDGRHTIIGPGLVRRAHLCISMVQRVLPLWEMHYPSKHPHRILEEARAYLDGRSSRKQLRDEASGFRGGLDTSDTPDKQVAFLVGRASVSAAFVAASDELLEPDEGATEEELMDPEDPDFWDCAYWVAGAEAGGMPWEAGFDAQRYRDFWNWYLDTAVAAAFATVPG
jgi:hypothetical protein